MQFCTGHQGTFPHPTPSTFLPWVSESTRNPVLATDPCVKVSSALQPRWGLKASLHVPSLPWAVSLPFSTLFSVTNLPCWVCGKQLEGFHACSVLLLLYPPQQAWIYSNLPFIFLVFFLLFSAASYDFSFLADSGLEICLSSSPVLPPAVTLPTPRACFPQAHGDVLGRTWWKAAAFSVGGLPPLPNYPPNLQKAAGASAASPRRCRHSREEHWGAVPTASMQLLTLLRAFPGKKRLRSLCQSRRDVGSASKLQPCLGLEHPPF